jgi:hypothetical protein
MWKFCDVHIDDIIVFSRSWEEHLGHIRQVFECFREAGLTASIEKSKFFLESVAYLCLGVSEEGLIPKEDKIEAITNFQTPSNRKELERFLGMCGFYQKFVDSYATITEPLNVLRRRGALEMVF